MRTQPQNPRLIILPLALAGFAEALEKAVEEDSRLTFFVAGDVLVAPRNEFSEFFRVRYGVGICKG